MYYRRMQDIIGFLINLSSRQDRLADCQSQFSKIPCEVIRVSAVDAKEINNEELFVPAGVAATWRSHQLAMNEHLLSGFRYALILEDDFIIKKNIEKILKLVSAYTEYDLVQIGFLNPSFLRRVIRYGIDYRDLFLKLLFRANELCGGKLTKKLLVKEQKRVPFFLVLNDFQAGGHSYIVSRKFSEAAQKMNNPAFLSADGMLMALSETRTFRVARTRISLVSQSNSKTSVVERYKRY